MESLINDILTDPTFIKVGIVLAILIALALFKEIVTSWFSITYSRFDHIYCLPGLYRGRYRYQKS